MQQVTADDVRLPLEHELRERLGWLVRLRWFAGLGLVTGSAVGLPLIEFPVPYPLLTVVGIAVLGYNELFFLFGDRMAETLRSQQRAVHAQIALDWLALAATIALTGGIRSPATVGFVFHLIIGSILLSRRTCYLLAAAAVLLTALLGGLTPPIISGPAGPGGPPPPSLVALWAALSFLFLCTTYLATSITARLREKEAALAASEHSLEHAYRRMQALHEVGRLVNSSLDLNEVLALIAEHATHLLGGRGACIRLLSADGRSLTVGGTFGLSRAYVEKGPVDLDGSILDAETVAGQVVEIRDVTADRRFQYPEQARREGLVSILCCPMRARDRTLGAVRVYTGEPRSFDAQDRQLLSSLADLGAVAIENARAYGELKALDRERGWFARTTHHQLRSPLAAVQSAIDALPFAGPVSAGQQDLLARARRRIQDAFDLIRDLLDLAAAQRRATDGPTGPVRLDRSLERTVAAAQERCRAKGLEFMSNLDTGAWGVPAEAIDLERIFANLLDNAVKYTAAGHVTLTATARDGWIEASVEDSGIGIEPADIAHLYDSFFRAAAARATGEIGTGLGLSIVRQLLVKLGGSVRVDSTPGGGSRFIVRLPAITIPDASRPIEPAADSGRPGD